MLILKGKLLKTYDSTFKIKRGDKAGQDMTTRTLQILSNGGDKVVMFNVTDFDCREWKTGDIELPVYVRVFNRANGKPGYSFSVAKGD